MFKINGMLIAAAFGLMTALPQTAAADVRIFPYHTSENFCPAGLQPVTISGVICCGKPNQSVSYQSVMAHPVAKKKHHKVTHRARASKSNCPIGTKGCTFD